MSDPVRYDGRMPSARQQQAPAGNSGTNLADILERVLDKGIVIAGDVQINLLDIELLTIKLRLVVASVDKAKEMGIDWWERDPTLSSGQQELQEENRRLRERLEALESRANGSLEGPADDADDVVDAEPDEMADDEPDDADIDDADIVDEPDDEPDDEPVDDTGDVDEDTDEDTRDVADDREAEPAPAPRRRRGTRRESGGSRR